MTSTAPDGPPPENLTARVFRACTPTSTCTT
jgi:hypothetical protein